MSALAYSVARERCARPGDDLPGRANRAAAFVEAQVARSPQHMGPALRVATLVFDGWPLLRLARPFHDLPHEARLAQIVAWREARLAPRRDLMRFYESLVVFCWYAS